MKYSAEISITLPRAKVIELFAKTENLSKWQPGLKSFEHLSGQPGEEGATSSLTYEGRKGDLLMTETITSNKLPEELHMRYKAQGVQNEVYNYFEEKGEKLTLWRTVNIFKFRGLMALMAPFMKSAFAKNTQLSMERFRTFAENPES